MKQLTSPKHPNWIIEKEGNSFSMQHKDYPRYWIDVVKTENGWFGEILTEQKIEGLPGETEWLPAQSAPMFAPLEKVKKEVIRRGEYHKNLLLRS